MRPPNPNLPGLPIELPSTLNLITLSERGFQETNLGVGIGEGPPKIFLVEL